MKVSGGTIESAKIMQFSDIIHLAPLKIINIITMTEFFPINTQDPIFYA